ncbi:MAG: hypothetical protein KAT68_09350 [Bacteroidales bacterium]|nr:hypothetical protein [Bacteroidales bacterium]
MNEIQNKKLSFVNLFFLYQKNNRIRFSIYSIIKILILIIPINIFAQGEIEEEHKILFRNESTYGIILNSNGWGFGYKYAKRIDAFSKQIYEIHFHNIKHPKEVVITNIYQKRFVFGKENVFYNINIGIGKHKKLYSKLDKGGIEIRFLYSGGISLGITKPIYYIIPDSVDYFRYTKFNSSIHTSWDIISKASYFKGFKEIKFIPGIYVKSGFAFEFSKEDIKVNSLEAGVKLTVFPKEIPILANIKNDFIFFSLFVSYRFGKVINVRVKDKSLKKINKKE